ncbi:hypothetical protein [Prevotella histicola]
MVIKAQETDGMIVKDVLSCAWSCGLTGYETVFEALKHAFSPIIRAGTCD